MDISWQAKYEINIRSIDSQHRLFFDIFRRIDRNRSNPDILAALKDELLKFSDFHFTSEENLLEEYQYQNVGKHAIAHNELMSQLRANLAEVGSVDKLLLFLIAWIVNHINEEDKEYANYIRQQLAA